MPSNPTIRDLIDRLQALLAQEKSMLLSGRLTSLADICAEKEELSRRLDAMLGDRANAASAPAFRKALAALVSLAQENEKLLGAAQSGVAFAQTRLKDIINRQRNVGVYSETGDKPLIPGAAVTRRKFA